MKLFAIRGLFLTAVALALQSSPGYAQCPACGKGVPCVDPCPYREVEVTVNRRVEVKVPTCECEKRRFLTADVVPVNRVVWEEIEVVRDIVKDVTVCKTVPVCIKDPCTGCTRTEYQQQTCVEKQVCQVIETIPVKRQYKAYALVNWKTNERVVPKTCTVYECRPEKVITKVPACAAGPEAIAAPAPAIVPEQIAAPIEKK